MFSDAFIAENAFQPDNGIPVENRFELGLHPVTDNAKHAHESDENKSIELPMFDPTEIKKQMKLLKEL